jgi:uncharacterized repeat protein (TIGR03847 family)
MANPILEFDPVSHITAGALGRPGERTFYIQAERGLDRVTLVCEKEQVQALCEAIDEMVENLQKEFGVEGEKAVAFDDVKMTVREPAEPLFRIGAMALGYDAGRDRVLLVVQEALADEEERDPREVRLYASRTQMQTLSVYARDTVMRGRSPEQRALQAEAHSRRNGHGE